jgi:hypothetical protein
LVGTQAHQHYKNLYLSVEFHRRIFSFCFSLGAQGKFIAIYLLGMFIPYIYGLYLIWAVFEMFTPILGRSGTEIPPDVVLASILAGCIMILSSYFVRKKVLLSLFFYVNL